MAMNLSSTTVGILGGMGPAAGANFLSLLVAEFNRAGIVEDAMFPRIILLSIPLQNGWDHLGAKDKASVARQVRQGTDWLESFGASLIAVPCNSVHEFIESKRVVSILDSTLAACGSAETIGVLCSRQARESRLYERNGGKQYLYCEDQAQIDTTIAAVLAGVRPRIDHMVGELFARGAAVVILGCTELSLCGYSKSPAIVDSSIALAAAVAQRVLSGGGAFR